MTGGLIQQELSTGNVYTPKARTPGYLKQMSTDSETQVPI